MCTLASEWPKALVFMIPFLIHQIIPLSNTMFEWKYFQGIYDIPVAVAMAIHIEGRIMKEFVQPPDHPFIGIIRQQRHVIK